MPAARTEAAPMAVSSLPLVVPIVITSTSSSDNLRDADAAAAAAVTSDGSDGETETVPLSTGECETRFGGTGIVRPGNLAGSEVTFLAPFQRISALTPAAAGFVGTIQRRLSTANSSISEGKKNGSMLAHSPSACWFIFSPDKF
jgi:hypothetical protein